MVADRLVPKLQRLTPKEALQRFREERVIGAGALVVGTSLVAAALALTFLPPHISFPKRVVSWLQGRIGNRLTLPDGITIPSRLQSWPIRCTLGIGGAALWVAAREFGSRAEGYKIAYRELKDAEVFLPEEFWSTNVEDLWQAKALTVGPEGEPLQLIGPYEHIKRRLERVTANEDAWKEVLSNWNAVSNGTPRQQKNAEYLKWHVGRLVMSMREALVMQRQMRPTNGGPEGIFLNVVGALFCTRAYADSTHRAHDQTWTLLTGKQKWFTRLGPIPTYVGWMIADRTR